MNGKARQSKKDKVIDKIKGMAKQSKKKKNRQTR